MFAPFFGIRPRSFRRGSLLTFLLPRLFYRCHKVGFMQGHEYGNHGSRR
jgi:hypothetical protein